MPYTHAYTIHINDLDAASTSLSTCTSLIRMSPHGVDSAVLLLEPSVLQVPSVLILCLFLSVSAQVSTLVMPHLRAS